jgi:hypothetical protein
MSVEAMHPDRLGSRALNWGIKRRRELIVAQLLLRELVQHEGTIYRRRTNCVETR